MQDLHSIPGGAPGGFFPTGGGVSGADASTTPCPTSFIDRRLRPHPQQNLKCPRCDSLNTKFCYYNNYNLSQPRHFCKSCRRYWTKGGVLRNVPVGGGCRKSSSKRSSASSSITSSSSKASKSNSSSSPSSSSWSSGGSDSSTLTTITTPPDAPLATPEIFPPTTATALTSTMGYNFSNLYAFQIPPPQQHQTLIKVDVDDHVMAAMEEIKVPPEDVGFMDQAVPSPMDLPPLLDGRTGSSGELAAIDWQGCLDSTLGFFDPVVGTAGDGDHSFFWSQSQWGVDTEPTPHLP